MDKQSSDPGDTEWKPQLMPKFIPKPQPDLTKEQSSARAYGGYPVGYDQFLKEKHVEQTLKQVQNLKNKDKNPQSQLINNSAEFTHARSGRGAGNATRPRAVANQATLSALGM